MTDSNLASYMPPEVDVEGCTHRAVFADDVWSLGVTMYRLMTGRLPKRVSSEPPDSTRWGGPLVDLTMRMLAPEARSRETIQSILAKVVAPPPSRSVTSSCCADLMRQAHARIGQSLDLCFVIDATSSMSSWIEGARRKVGTLCSDVLSGHARAVVRWAAVCYRDPIDAPGDIHQSCDFVKRPGDLASFMSGIQATGGGDTSEDWVGAMRRVLSLSWSREAKKAIVWIADAGGHGGICGHPGEHEAEAGQFEPWVRELARQRIRIVGLHVLPAAIPSFQLMRRTYVSMGLGDRCEIFSFDAADRRPEVSDVEHISQTIATMATSVMKGAFSEWG